MSWDLTIRSLKGSLGSQNSVREAIAQVFPSAQFGSEPSGIEKVRIAEAQSIRFPPFIRESMISQPARHGAELEMDGVSLRFNFGSEDLVREIGVEVRGAGDPFPYLRRLAEVTEWQVIDDSTGRLLNADAQPVGTGWEIYLKMVAQARNHE